MRLKIDTMCKNLEFGIEGAAGNGDAPGQPLSLSIVQLGIGAVRNWGYRRCGGVRAMAPLPSHVATRLCFFLLWFCLALSLLRTEETVWGLLHGRRPFKTALQY
jgi:hypothetical protein